MKSRREAIDAWREIHEWTCQANDQLEHASKTSDMAPQSLETLERELSTWRQSAPKIDQMCQKSHVLPVTSAVQLVSNVDSLYTVTR